MPSLSRGAVVAITFVMQQGGNLVIQVDSILRRVLSENSYHVTDRGELPGTVQSLLSGRNGLAGDLSINGVENFLETIENGLDDRGVHFEVADRRSALLKCVFRDGVRGYNAPDDVLLAMDFPPRDPRGE
jgi:hypothetical protein